MAEEEVFLKEMEAQQETMEERQQKMSVRAKELKQKREAERLKVVQEKLDQQWRFVKISFMISIIHKNILILKALRDQLSHEYWDHKYSLLCID